MFFKIVWKHFIRRRKTRSPTPLSPGGCNHHAAKKGRKEINLKDLDDAARELFVGKKMVQVSASGKAGWARRLVMF